MNVKLALKLLAVALVSGCAGTPTWDTSVFPPQVVYDAPASPAPIAAAAAK
jgi:hypothetical protein